MKEESLKMINDSLDKQKVKQLEIAKLTKIAASQINEMLNGKRMLSVKFSVWIEILTKGEIKAEWILKTEFEERTLNDLEYYRSEAIGKLKNMQEDLSYKINLLEK